MFDYEEDKVVFFSSPLFSFRDNSDS